MTQADGGGLDFLVGGRFFERSWRERLLLVDRMTDDAELLRQYAATNSQAAFAELVQRYVNLVYSIALRKVEGNAHLAEEVTQNVFTDLARKASALSAHPVLTGWLFKSAHFSGNTLLRSARTTHAIPGPRYLSSRAGRQ
jgi:DNA-directed RNA polymerase specialized sigma24 family protein